MKNNLVSFQVKVSDGGPLNGTLAYVNPSNVALVMRATKQNDIDKRVITLEEGSVIYLVGGPSIWVQDDVSTVVTRLVQASE